MKYIFYSIIIAIILVTGVLCAPTCIDYLLYSKSSENGSVKPLEKQPLPEYDDFYLISYNLNGGSLLEDNPVKYDLFTEEFTLNNPTRQNYDFIGWSGSKLNENTITVKIDNSYSGDLSFVANWKVSLKAPQIQLNGSVVSWEPVVHATSYKLYCNNQIIPVNTTSFDLETLNCFSEGLNTIKACSCVDDIVSEWSNECYYFWYNPSSLENLSCNLLFSKTSDYYSLNVVFDNNYTEGSYNILTYYYNTDVLQARAYGSFAGGKTFADYEEDYNDNLILRFVSLLLNYNHEAFNLSFTNTNAKNSILEIINTIEQAYTGRDSETINIGSCLKFNFKGATGSYTPTTTNLNVQYIEMYTPVNFYENCSINLAEYSAYNVGRASYTVRNSNITRKSYEIELMKTNNSTIVMGYDNTGWYIGDAGGAEYYSKSQFDNIVSSMKFKLDGDFVYKINASELINYIKEPVDDAFTSNMSTWSGTRTFDLHVAPFITAYTDNTLTHVVDFNYDLTLTFNISANF